MLELRRELAESRSTAAAHAQELSAQREQMRALRHERDAAQSQVIPWWLRRSGRTASDVSGWTQRPSTPIPGKLWAWIVTIRLACNIRALTDVTVPGCHT
eukprot:COSAG01_NODE_36415_length_518_cov_0.763723_1_plen_99_part_10